MSRRLIPLACALVVAGCNLLTLDGLSAGDDGGGAASGVVASGSDATTGDPSTASGSTTSSSPPSSSASTSGAGGDTSSGDGGAGGSAGDGGGGASSSSALTGGGGSAGGCSGPTFCDVVGGQDGVAVCDDFDDDELLDDWEMIIEGTVDPRFEVVDDRFSSCPHAARIQFNGAAPPNPGGWAEMGRRLEGVPTGLTMSARIFRETTNVGPEGALEIQWDRGEHGCFLQARFGTDPASVEVSGRQYDDVGNGVVLGDDYVEDSEIETVGRWMDVDFKLTFGSGGGGSVTLEGVTASFLFDTLDADAFCDEGPDADSVLVAVGPPYNSAPTVLYVDDYFVTATY